MGRATPSACGCCKSGIPESLTPFESVQTRAAMVQRIAQTMRAFRMHLGEQWAPLWLSLHKSVQKMLVETYQMTAE